MKRLPEFFDKYILTIFIFLVFLLEGMGFSYGAETAYILIIAMPFFLLFIDIIRGRKLYLPKAISILFILFLIVSSITILYSTNMQVSFERELYLVSLFLTFIYVFNHKTNIVNGINRVLICLGAIYIFLPFFADRFGIHLLPYVENLARAASETGHNNLGDFLGLVLIILFQYNLTGKKVKYVILISILFFFYIFITSFSRTAYISFFLTEAIVFIGNVSNLSKTRKLVFVFILLISFCMFVLANTTAGKITWVNNIFNYIGQKYEYKERTIISGRNYYYAWALDAIKERPLTGVGLGNFWNAATRYSRIPLNVTASSTNLFLDYFTEGGIVVGIIFMLLIFYLLSRCRFHPLLLYLFLSFQTYLWFRLYSVFMLFIIMIALNLKDDEKSFIQLRSEPIIIVSLFLFIVANLVLLSSIFFKKEEYSAALFLYPINQAASSALASRYVNRGDVIEGLRLVNLGIYLAPGCSSCLNFNGNLYLKSGDKKKALNLFLQAYYWNPYALEYGYRRVILGYQLIARKIYELEIQIYGEEKAIQFLQQYLSRLEKSKSEGLYGDALVYEDAQTMCSAIYYGKCPYRL